MKKKKQAAGRVAVSIMAAAMTMTALPVSAAEMPPAAEEQTTEKGVVLQEEAAEETLEPESGIKDTTAPVLNGISVSATKVTAPGTVEIIADISDDISGVDYASVTVSTSAKAPSDAYTSSKSVTLSSTYYDKALGQTVKYADGKMHGTFDTSAATPGTYTISSVSLSDRAGNGAWYSSYNMPDSIKNISLQVIGGETISSLTLKSVSFEKTTIQAGETVEVTAWLDGDVSDVSGISLSLRTEDKTKFLSFYLSANGDGSFSGDCKVSDYQKVGDYKLYDTAVNRIGSSSVYIGVPEALANTTVRITNDKEDTTPPTIQNLVLGSASVDVPGHMGFTAWAADDLSGVRYVEVRFKNETTGKSLYGSQIFGENAQSGSITVDQYTDSGVYQISSIRVDDIAGNSIYYSDSGLDATPIPDSLKNLKFTVNNDADGADLITSTLSPTLVKDITDAKDGAVINVDISEDQVIKKAVLDAVKGTNKVLQLNSDGIQWVIKGSDIQGETKDLDLSGKISYGYANYDSDLYSMLDEYNYVGMTFADHTELPCKALVRFMPAAYLTDEVGSSNLYVYYYNEADSKLEAVASGISLTKENNLEFYVTRGGHYIVTNGPAKSTSFLPDVPDTWENMTGIEGFVQRCYNFALGRDAEEAGMQDWTSRLQTKSETAAQVAQGFIFSQEFLNQDYSDSQFVEILYRMMFGRTADKDGKAYWMSYLASGVSREYVYRGFAESQEFSNLCGNFGVERGTVTLSAYRDRNANATGFIARLYTKMLGRDFDDDGIEYWCEKYLTGEQSIEQIASNGFLHSDEFTNQNLSNEEFVTRMYRTFLNRAPEKAGLKDWVNRLETGEVTRDTLVYGFTNSQEFANLKALYQLP